MDGSFDEGQQAPPAVPTPQDATRASIALATAANLPVFGVLHSNAVFATDDTEETVRGWVRERLHGLELSGKPVWMRVWQPHDDRGVLAVLHAFVPPGEMELILLANHGAISRSILHAIAAWAFRHIGAYGLLRVAIRLPAEAEALIQLAQRAGFKVEGRVHAHYQDGTDAVLLGMTRASCPWLLPTSALDALTSPDPSNTRH